MVPGGGDWEELEVVSLGGAESSWLSFGQGTEGEWIRGKKRTLVTKATVHFVHFLNPEQRQAYQEGGIICSGDSFPFRKRNLQAG